MVYVSSHDIEVTKLAFNKKDREEISRICHSLNEFSIKAKYLLYMNSLIVVLGVFYYSIFNVYQNFIVIIHGIIFLFILKEYQHQKCFVYHDFKKYLKIIENFFRKKKVYFNYGDYISSWSIHGAVSLAGERIMVQTILDDALENISSRKKWVHLFHIPKIIRVFAGIPF